MIATKADFRNAAPDLSMPLKKSTLPVGSVAVRHDLFGIDLNHRPDPLTTLAGPERRVERERTRFERGDVDAAIDTRHLFGKHLLFAVDDRNNDRSAGEFERGFDRFGKAFANALLHQQAIDDDFDRVIFAFVENDLFVELTDLAVDTGPQKTVFMQLFEFLFEFTFAATNERCENHHAFALGQFRNARYDLLDRLPRDRLPALMTMRLADRREQQAKKIVNFRHGSNRRTRRTRDRLLLDRDRGRQTFDRINVRLFKLIEELSSVRRQRFDITPLPLGIDRVERERSICPNLTNP